MLTLFQKGYALYVCTIYIYRRRRSSTDFVGVVIITSTYFQVKRCCPSHGRAKPLDASQKKQKHPTISPCCVICYNRFLIQNARRDWTNSSKLEFCQCNTNDIQLYFIVKCHSSPCFPTMLLISENQAGAMVSGEDFPQTNPLNLVFVASRILIVESPFFVS